MAPVSGRRASDLADFHSRSRVSSQKSIPKRNDVIYTGGKMQSRIILAVMMIVVLSVAANLVAQTDPDPGIPDTVRINGPIQIPDIVEGDSFNIPIYIWHDEPLGGFSLGFEFDYDYVVIQSIDFEGSVLNGTQQAFINKLFYPEDKQVLIGWAPFNPSLYGTVVEGDTAVPYFNLNMRVLEGATPMRVSVDSVFVPPAGNFILSVDADTGAGYDISAITPQFVGVGVGLDVSNIESPILPKSFSLSQNAPNPFNPNTSIDFALPRSAHVTIDVYNTLGQKVATLVDEPLNVGLKRVEWDGTDYSGQPVASGVYFYRMTADEFSETKKMMLLK
jgi:hypothetical protein